MPSEDVIRPSELLSQLSDGATLTNDILGTGIPLIRNINDLAELRNLASCGDADRFFAALTREITAESQTDFEKNLPGRCLAMIGGEPMAERTILAQAGLFLWGLNDEELLTRINQAFDVRDVDLLSTTEALDYVSVKVNHGWWEQAVIHFLAGAGISYFRDGRGPQWFELYGFDTLLLRSIRSMAQVTGECLNLIREHSSFAISFNAGNLWHRDILPPLPPYIRGAMMGALSCFEAAKFSKPFRVADGAAAKKLVYEDRLRTFCEVLRRISDVTVFVVPDHLRGIALFGWPGPTEHIVVPSRRICDFWPSVVPYIVGKIHALRHRYAHVTILMQAAAMSAPIGAVLSSMIASPGGHIHAYDLGQVLDLAEPPGRRTYQWAKDLEQYPELDAAGGGCFSLRDKH